MINQVNYVLANLDTMEPFQHLLKLGVHFLLEQCVAGKFEDAKAVRVDKVKDGVRRFKIGRKMCLT